MPIRFGVLRGDFDRAPSDLERFALDRQLCLPKLLSSFLCLLDRFLQFSFANQTLGCQLPCSVLLLDCQIQLESRQTDLRCLAFFRAGDLFPCRLQFGQLFQSFGTSLFGQRFRILVHLFQFLFTRGDGRTQLLNLVL